MHLLGVFRVAAQHLDVRLTHPHREQLDREPDPLAQLDAAAEQLECRLVVAVHLDDLGGLREGDGERELVTHLLEQPDCLPERGLARGRLGTELGDDTAHQRHDRRRPLVVRPPGRVLGDRQQLRHLVDATGEEQRHDPGDHDERLGPWITRALLTRPTASSVASIAVSMLGPLALSQP